MWERKYPAPYLNDLDVLGAGAFGCLFDLIDDRRGSLLGNLEFLCKMPNDLRLSHEFFSHFGPPLRIEY